MNSTDNATTLREALIKYNAIIAGGSVLKVYAKIDKEKWPNTDIDIYINQKNATNFVNSIKNICTFSIKSHTASAYCMSFFRKNKIMARITGEISAMKIPFDIMIVENSRNLTDVVTNFDLTFCEIWYDGNAIYATEKDVTKKKGILRKEYKDALFKENNFFIQTRIKKYTTRGFSVEVSNSTEPIYLEFLTNNNYKVIDNPEEWAVKLIIGNVFAPYRNNSCYYNNGLLKTHSEALAMFMCSFTSFTISQLETNLATYITPHIMNCYTVEMPISFKACYVYILHKIYQYIGKKYFKYITTYLKIRKSDIREIFEEDSISAYLNRNSATATLLNITKAEYDTFIKNTTHGTCITPPGQIEIKAFLKEPENIVLLGPSGEAVCTNRSFLEMWYKDKRNRWVYECTGKNLKASIIRSRPYIKLPLSFLGTKGALTAVEVASMLRSKRKLFMIKPYIKNQQHLKISYTTCYKNAPAASATLCSTSDILLYRVYEYNSKFKFEDQSSLSNSDNTPIFMSASSSSDNVVRSSSSSDDVRSSSSDDVRFSSIR